MCHLQLRNEEDSKDEESAALAGGFIRGFSVMKGLSSFIKASENEDNERIVSEIDDDDHLDELATEDKDVTVRRPEFEGSLIPISDEQGAARFRSELYPWNRKMLTALGVEPLERDSIASSSKDRKILCDRAMEYLRNQTEDCRAKYVSEFLSQFQCGCTSSERITC